MAAPRKPQDRAEKTPKDRSGEPFEFDHDGATYRLAPSNTLTVGFARKIRKLHEADQFFTILEALADDDTLAAIDDMDKTEFTAFREAYFKFSGVTPGE